MSAKYIAKGIRQGRVVPYCNLPGSPYGSRRQAQQAAHKAGIEQPIIQAVRRQPCG